MKIMLLITASLILWGCGTDSEDEARPATVGQEIADDYNSAIDKAQNVENQVMDQKRKLDEALDDIE